MLKLFYNHTQLLLAMLMIQVLEYPFGSLLSATFNAYAILQHTVFILIIVFLCIAKDIVTKIAL